MDEDLTAKRARAGRARWAGLTDEQAAAIRRKAGLTPTGPGKKRGRPKKRRAPTRPQTITDAERERRRQAMVDRWAIKRGIPPAPTPPALPTLVCSKCGKPAQVSRIGPAWLVKCQGCSRQQVSITDPTAA